MGDGAGERVQHCREGGNVEKVAVPRRGCQH